MMKLQWYVGILAALAMNVSTAFSQTADKDAVLMRINGDPVMKSDFLYVYNKNNNNPQVIDPKTVDEYLELFINFNLKVKEAVSLGMDTTKAFKTELAGYRKQLAQPYLTDTEVTERLIQEAWERLQTDLRASHILFSLPENALPKDTLVTYNKALKVRERIMAGEDFTKMAREFSDDPSARDMAATAQRPPMPGNNGDLGYFTAFDMVYPFENGAFALQKGEVSMPIRSAFGYHIIKLTDRKPAMGRVRVAHIMVNASPESEKGKEEDDLKTRINEIYNRLAEGADFVDMAKRYSDDRGTAQRGGELPWFGVNRMVPEFIEAIKDLKNPGDISKPVRTAYGWHVIKLIEQKKPLSLEEEYPELKNKVGRDVRARLSKDAVINRLKNEYSFKENTKALDEIIKLVDNSIFDSKWNNPKALELKGNLFSFANNAITQGDFAAFLIQKQNNRTPEEITSYIHGMYREYVAQTLLDYEDLKLEDKYLDFKQIMREYHDGILLFELTDKKVWSKALQDTTGLKKFYQDNIQNYMWNDRLHATFFICNDEAVAKNAVKLVKKAPKKKWDDEYVLAQINKESQLSMRVLSGKFEKDANIYLEHFQWKKGLSGIVKVGNEYVFTRVENVIPAEPKALFEIRGIVTADYQNFLEKQWIEELKAKYTVEVNAEVLQSLRN